MTREDIQRRIADLDTEINRILGNARLPSLEIRPFPKGTWILFGLCLVYYFFGADIPYVDAYHNQYARYAFYASGILAILALWGTLTWLFRRGGGFSKEYGEATAKVKDLQNERRELQAELKELQS
jgi:hypothetical protein